MKTFLDAYNNFCEHILKNNFHYKLLENIFVIL